MQDIFDEIIDCIRSEQDSYGTVYVGKSHLLEFAKDIPAAGQPQPASPAPARSIPASPAPAHIGTPPAEIRKDPVFAPAPNVSAMGWTELKQAVATCHACRLCQQRQHTVFSDGNEHAELMFIGEGPGADEDAQGVPFVGRAGQLLTKMITAMQFRREEVYIANIVKCRPPGNRNPEDDEAAVCLPYLQRQIELVSPKVIVLLGNIALKGLLNRSGISKHRGQWTDYHGIMVMPTFHPSYLLRFEHEKGKAWSDLQQVMKVFGKVYKKQIGS